MRCIFRHPTQRSTAVLVRGMRPARTTVPSPSGVSLIILGTMGSLTLVQRFKWHRRRSAESPRRRSPAIWHCFDSIWLERAQKIDDFLLLLNGQPMEVFDDLIGLAAVAAVSPDGVDQVGRAPIMEEEDALSDAPERSSSELVGAGAALCNAVGQAFAHVVHKQVGEKVHRLPIGKRCTRTGSGAARNHRSGGKRRCMAVHTPNLPEQVASLFAGPCGWSGRGWSEQPHEVGKRFDVRNDRGVRNTALRVASGRGSGCEVKRVVGVESKRQPGSSSRSCGNSWFEIPISTL